MGYASGLVQPLSTGCPWSAKSLGHGCTLPLPPLPGLEAGLVLSQPSFIMVTAQGTLHITAWPSSACSLLVLVPHPFSALQWEKTSTQPGLPSCLSQLQQSAMGALVGTCPSEDLHCQFSCAPERGLGGAQCPAFSPTFGLGLETYISQECPGEAGRRAAWRRQLWPVPPQPAPTAGRG